MPASLPMLAFTGLIAIPEALYLCLAHPAWSWLYALDPAAMPELVLLLLALLQGGAVLGGWWLGALLARAKRRNVRLALIAALGLVVVVLVALLSDRLRIYGSFQAHVAGATVGIMEVALGYALIALVLGKGTASVLVAIELARDSRRARLR